MNLRHLYRLGAPAKNAKLGFILSEMRALPLQKQACCTPFEVIHECCNCNRLGSGCDFGCCLIMDLGAAPAPRRFHQSFRFSCSTAKKELPCRMQAKCSCTSMRMAQHENLLKPRRDTWTLSSHPWMGLGRTSSQIIPNVLHWAKSEVTCRALSFLSAFQSSRHLQNMNRRNPHRRRSQSRYPN